MVKRIAFDEYFDAGLKRWIYRTAHSNYWRVAAWLDIDDLIQEGFLCFAICRARYVPANKSHFMSLVKITFLNQITDLANKRTRTPECPISDIAVMGNEEEMLEILGGSDDGDIEVMALLARAPREVQQILAAMNTNEGAACLRRVYRIRQDKTRETNNERLCRIAGIPLFDFEGALRALLA